MIPVKQIGWDCFAAAAASILELPLTQVPPYGPEIDWVVPWQRFLFERNLFQMGLPVDPTWKNVPPGWSILTLRCTDDDPQKLDWQLHCLVCRNGVPVWDPNGFDIPRGWDGLIESRKWQVVEPCGWVVFATLDPTVRTHEPVPISEPFIAMMEEARALMDELQRRTPSPREGVNFPYLRNHMDKVIAAYTDAATDTEGEQAAVQALRSLKEGYLALQAAQQTSGH